MDQPAPQPTAPELPTSPVPPAPLPSNASPPEAPGPSPEPRGPLTDAGSVPPPATPPVTVLLTARERRWLTILLTLGSIALFFVVLDQLAGVWAVFSDLIMIFFFAWLLGFVLEPVAGWLARWMPRVIAVAIAYGAVAVVAFGLVVVAASALFTSISDFLGNLDQFQQDLIRLITPISDWLVSLGFDQVDLNAQIESLLQTLAAQAQNLLGPLQDVAVASLGMVGNVLVLFFLAIFISIDRAAIGSFLLRLVPPAYSEEAHLLSESVSRSFGGFIRGMLIIGGTYALVALLANVLLGLEYAPITTTLSGLLMAIPFFGPFVSWSPPVIVAAVTKPDVLVWTLLIMVVGWFVNQNILQPKVLANAVGLHPVVVLASVLIGLKLFGIPGAIFGLPVAAVIASFFFYFLRRNVKPDERSVAARAARRLFEREGRRTRVPREPLPGEEEELEEAARGRRSGAPVGGRTVAGTAMATHVGAGPDIPLPPDAAASPGAAEPDHPGDVAPDAVAPETAGDVFAGPSPAS
jgi:predicted PurR-regulated permease PerM